MPYGYKLREFIAIHGIFGKSPAAGFSGTMRHFVSSKTACNKNYLDEVKWSSTREIYITAGYIAPLNLYTRLDLMVSIEKAVLYTFNEFFNQILVSFPGVMLCCFPQWQCKIFVLQRQKAIVKWQINLLRKL